MICPECLGAQRSAGLDDIEFERADPLQAGVATRDRMVIALRTGEKGPTGALSKSSALVR